MIIAPDETSAQRTGVQTITFGVGTTIFGLILVASTSQGICAVLLGSSRKVLIGQLRSAFPKATLRDGQREIGHILNNVIHCIETPTVAPAVPLDVHGTLFQKRVWDALTEIPVGQTTTYKEIAFKLGATAQEIGEACAANCLAVLIPCHRVIRSDGGLAGYRWGTNRKRRLLAREQELSPDPESFFSVLGFAKSEASVCSGISTATPKTNLSLGSGKKGHYDQGDAGQNDARNAVFGSATGP